MTIQRTVLRRTFVFSVSVVAWATSHLLDAQGPPKFVLIRGSELAAAVNLPDKNLKLEGSLFVPAKAATIRAVIVFMEHGEIEERILTGRQPYSPWHSAA